MCIYIEREREKERDERKITQKCIKRKEGIGVQKNGIGNEEKKNIYIYIYMEREKEI